MRFQVLKTVSMKMIVFRDVSPCSLGECGSAAYCSEKCLTDSNDDLLSNFTD
jgi:hypothetical protein